MQRMWVACAFIWAPTAADGLHFTDQYVCGLPSTGQGHHYKYTRAQIHGRLRGDVWEERNGAPKFNGQPSEGRAVRPVSNDLLHCLIKSQICEHGLYIRLCNQIDKARVGRHQLRYRLPMVCQHIFANGAVA